MPDSPFIEVQHRFTAHIRDPARCPAPEGVEDRRLGIYRNLLYNNVQGFIANGFPVIRSLFDDDRWHAMIRDYFAKHRAHTPLFPRMPQEFLHYLANERIDPDDPPFLAELAHYEWLEVEVSLDTHDLEACAVDAAPDLLDGRPVPNPAMRPCAYSYPVHRVSPDMQPQSPGPSPTYLVVYRNRKDETGFMELNAVSARLLELILGNETASARTLLRKIAAELGHADPGVVIEGGRTMLEMFLEKGIVLGTVTASA